MAELDNVTEMTEAEQVNEVESTTENTEVAKLRAELAKQKAALDKATKEAADSKRQLRAKQSAEEAAAEEAREAAEAKDRELADLRKRFAVAEITKKVMGIIGDEETSTSVAGCLYGAEDVDSALMAFQKAWAAKEKALRMEYGKIPAPGVGGTEGATITREQLDAMSYLERIEFANTHPDEYNKIMGR
jgi:hypothetical protein